MNAYILFTNEVQEDDIEILLEASRGSPGLARLVQVRVGRAEPNAPNSKPVFSRSGGKFGFIAPESQPPFSLTYRLTGYAPPVGEVEEDHHGA